MPRKPKPMPSTAALTVTPNPIPLGTESIVISGTGFPDRVSVWIATPQDISSHEITTNLYGIFAFRYDRLWHIPDTSLSLAIKAYDNAGKIGVPLATVTISVV